MDIATMANWFDILQDKHGSAYFTTYEKNLFLNRAQIELVNELLPYDIRKSDTVNLEISQDSISKISPLIYELPYLNMSSSGIITKAAVNTALDAMTSGAIMWRPLAIGFEYGALKLPIKYTRHNDKWEFEKNFFKKPSLNNPKVRETYNAYLFSPIYPGAKIFFTILKYPSEVDISGPTDSELPDSTHNRLVAIALEFAGFGSRDVLMSQMAQYQKSQIN